jgi:hypothetical protein
VLLHISINATDAVKRLKVIPLTGFLLKLHPLVLCGFGGCNHACMIVSQIAYVPAFTPWGSNAKSSIAAVLAGLLHLN